jgi:uncharacterized paraquat-inducible protein A
MATIIQCPDCKAAVPVNPAAVKAECRRCGAKLRPEAELRKSAR